MNYVPVHQRVAEYDKANPGQSTRQAAGDLGVSQSEVQRSRQSREPSGSPEMVTGKDGKQYPARRPEPHEPAPDTERKILTKLGER